MLCSKFHQNFLDVQQEYSELRRLGECPLCIFLSPMKTIIYLHVICCCLWSLKVKQTVQQGCCTVCFRLTAPSKVGKTFQLVKQVYAEGCLSHIKLYEWFKCLKEDREDIKDDEHLGSKNTMITESNMRNCPYVT